MIRFRLLGIDVRIDFWFVAVVTLFLLTDPSGISTTALLACLIHETAHIIAFLLCGYTPRALIFELTGIRLVKPSQALSPGKDALVQAAGSTANFLMFLLLSGMLGQISYWSVLAVTHLLLGCFNLLPLRCLDGGKLLELACLKWGGERAADRICTAADALVTGALLALCLYALLSGTRSFPLAFFAGGLSVAVLARLRPLFRRLPASCSHSSKRKVDLR